MRRDHDIAVHRLEPILAVADVAAAVAYYRDVLGFQKEWLWGTPPTHGGARLGGAGLQFTLDSQRASSADARECFIYVTGVEALYARHVERGADVVSPLGPKPWGMREFTVRDPSGYRIRFAEGGVEAPPSAGVDTVPDHIRIVDRLPTVEEFMQLSAGVGWPQNAEAVPVALKNSLFGVVALDGDKAVGTARVIGDGAKFFSVQDVMVLPAYQRQRIGTALLDSVMAYMEQAAPKGAFVSLFTTKPAFYARWGFREEVGMMISK